VKLSVVIPVYNEREQIGETLRELAEALRETGGLEAEVIVVDDGSSDGSADAALAAANGLSLSVVRQQNLGRFAARRAGLEAASGDYVLFIDSRVTLVPGSLGFAAERIARHVGEIWNAHTLIDTNGNPYGRFWNVLTELVFADYFSEPRTTTFSAADFDRFPKGTTCFLAPHSALRDAFSHFETRYADARHANDDTPIIRSLAEAAPINISPRFSCLYRPRVSLRGFVVHAYHRGIVFLDGHGRRESRFYPAVVAFYPVSALFALAIVRRPWLAPALLAGTAAAAGAVAAAKRRPAAETLAFAALTPVYACSHGAGMWRGVAMLARQRLRAAPAG
jgi:glycosyltransferase involved in cell wall biosynthesis